jgi:hypothetical protein
MSTPFYDLASVVVLPSGYKSGKIYAQKPLTTDGQLTFTRASTATRVNASGLIETVASGVPRLDYLGSTCPKLLLEPQRTNIALFSEQFDNAVYEKQNATVTSNATTSPDGTANADKLIPTTTSGFHSLDYVPSVIVTTYTLSVFAKAGEYSKIVLLTNNRGTNMARGFDLNNGTTFANDFGYSEPTSFDITNYGNGWYRCSITYPKTTTGTSGNGIAVVNDAGATTFAGNGTDGLFVYGFQMESGAAYISSYIKTEAAAVTRVADAASKTGISSLIGTEGVLFVEGSFAGIDPANTRRIVSLSDATTSNAVLIQNSSNSTTMQFVVVTSGTIQATITKSLAITFGQTFKAAFAYKANDFVAYINGEQIGTDASGTVPTCSKFAFDRGNATTAHEGTISQALLFKTRLTNAQLAELTTL